MTWRQNTLFKSSLLLEVLSNVLGVSPTVQAACPPAPEGAALVPPLRRFFCLLDIGTALTRPVPPQAGTEGNQLALTQPWFFEPA